MPTTGKKWKRKLNEPTPRQRAAALLIATNPDMPAGEALVLAGYSETVRKDPNRILRGKTITTIRDAYLEEINRKISPKLVAKRMKEGVKSKDLNTSLKYIQEYKRDIGITTDTPTTAIQFNLTPELTELAG